MPAGRRPFGVNLAGFHESEKGMGESVRAVRRALQAAGIAHVCNNIVDPGSVNVVSNGRFAGRNPFAINLICVNADQIGEFALRYGLRYFADRWNIGLWNWELARFPDEWTASFDFFDEIWVPSGFTQAAVAAAAPIPVRQIPYAIEAPHGPAGASRADFGLPTDAFIFLSAFDYHSVFERKNPLATVRAFQQAFGKNADYVLVLKATHGIRDPAADRLRTETAGWSNIIHLTRVLTRAEMMALTQACDAFVSLHRSEGFGLHLAEAMACGKPVVATDYSANTDFMTAENSFPVQYRLVEIAEEHGPYRRGQVWADPDIAHAAEQMQRAAEPCSAQLIGGRAQQAIRVQFNSARIGDLVRGALNVVSQRPPRVDWRRLPQPAANLCVRHIYRWWWHGTRGRFGVPPVAALRTAKQLAHRLGITKP